MSDEELTQPAPKPAEIPPKPATDSSNAFAVVALVLGVVGLVLTIAVRLAFALDVMAVVFGAFGMTKAREGAKDGGLAKAGMILGLVGLGLILLLFLLFHSTGFGHLGRFGHHFRRYG